MMDATAIGKSDGVPALTRVRDFFKGMFRKPASPWPDVDLRTREEWLASITAEQARFKARYNRR